MAWIPSFAVRTEQDPPLEIVDLRYDGGGRCSTCAADAHNLFDRGFIRRAVC
jgi:hypothetical protein